MDGVTMKTIKDFFTVFVRIRLQAHTKMYTVVFQSQHGLCLYLSYLCRRGFEMGQCTLQHYSKPNP